MDSNLIYSIYNRYISAYCPYEKKTINATRPTAIYWPTNFDKIIELSTMDKGICINLAKHIQANPILATKKKLKNAWLAEGKKLSSLPNDSEETVIPIKTTSTIVRLESIEHFWTIIGRVRWYDKDERRLTKNDLQRCITKTDIRYILTHMDNVLIPALTRAVSDGPLLQTIDQENHNNILAHIIIKGLEFYNGIMNNPDVSLYLYDQFYPVYDWLQSCI